MQEETLIITSENLAKETGELIKAPVIGDKLRNGIIKEIKFSMGFWRIVLTI